MSVPRDMRQAIQDRLWKAADEICWLSLPATSKSKWYDNWCADPEIGLRLGLVRGTNTVRLGLVLGVGLWLVVGALGVIQGVTDRLFAMSVVGGHARL